MIRDSVNFVPHMEEGVIDSLLAALYAPLEKCKPCKSVPRNRVCVYVCVHMYVYMCVCVCVCVCVYVSVCTCV